MLRALVELSAYYDPDPGAVFRRVLDAVTSQYGETMAMINLLDGDRIRYRAALHLDPRLEGTAIELRDSY